MYQLYIGNKNYSSWSLRPWILLRELNIPFDERQQVFKGASNYEMFRQFSPTGRVPVLVDGATTVWDSLAIVEYLAERHAGVWPVDSSARSFARCAAAEMHAGFPALRNQCSMSCGVRVQMKRVSTALQTEVARLNELWGQGLAQFGGPFLAGPQFGAVDAFFAPVAFRHQTYSLPFDLQAVAYIQRLLELRGMKQWYAAGVAERWRDPDHESEASEVGTITADYRALP